MTGPPGCVREGRLSRALVPVCAVNILVYGYVVCCIMLKRVPVMCLYYVCVHTYACMWMGDVQVTYPDCQGTAGCMGP